MALYLHISESGERVSASGHGSGSSISGPRTAGSRSGSRSSAGGVEMKQPPAQPAPKLPRGKLCGALEATVGGLPPPRRRPRHSPAWDQLAVGGRGYGLPPWWSGYSICAGAIRRTTSTSNATAPGIPASSGTGSSATTTVAGQLTFSTSCITTGGLGKHLETVPAHRVRPAQSQAGWVTRAKDDP
jgi:hypothetical protein